MNRQKADRIPIDLGGMKASGIAASAWTPRTLFDGTPVLIVPDTRIGEDAEGGWVLLKPRGTPDEVREHVRANMQVFGLVGLRFCACTSFVPTRLLVHGTQPPGAG
ncbi:MAG: hypothetical protein WCI17_10135 [bacterium]